MSKSSRLDLSAILLSSAIVVGILFRLFGLFGDLWLDEIWSLNLVSTLQSPFEIFSLRIDNNHPFNSLWLYLLGPGSAFWNYRLLSFVCSIMTIFFIWDWSKKEFPNVTPFLIILVSLSYVLTLYGSEARGYSPMILGAVVALRAQQQFFETGKATYLILFWLTSIFALVSHLTFIQIYFALALVHIVKIVQGTNPRRFLLLHVPYLLFISFYSGFFIIGLKFGGGPIHTLWDTFISTFSVGFGGDEINSVPTHIAAIYLFGSVLIYLLCLVTITRSWIGKRALNLFLSVLLLLVPIIFLDVLNPKFALARYLLPTMCASYFVISIFLAKVWERDRIGRLLVCIFMALYIAGNAHNSIQLAIYGRGQYQELLKHIAKNSKPDSKNSAKIGAVQDFQVRTTLSFYDPEVLVTKLQSNTELPAWIVVKSAEEYLVDKSLCEYFNSFRSAPVSGFSWKLFRCRSDN